METLFKTALLSDLPGLQSIMQSMDSEAITAKDSQGCTVLHKAVEHCFSMTRFERQRPYVQLLMDHSPQMLTEMNRDGKTALLLSLQGGYVFDLALMLLRACPATALLADITGRTPLHQAVAGFYAAYSADDTRQLRCFELVQLLLEQGADINAEDSFGETPLHHALRNASTYNIENFALLELLLENGAKVISKSGVCALTLVSDSEMLTNFIISKDPTCVNTSLNSELNPLCLAIKNNNLEVVRQLLSTNNDTELDASYIKLARESGASFCTIELLLEYVPDYDIDTRDSMGRTLLIEYATCAYNVEKLLQFDADVYLKADDGSTALMTAVKESNEVAAVELLVTAGSDILARNNDGQNIVTLAYLKYLEKTENNTPSSTIQALKNTLPILEYVFSLPEISSSSFLQTCFNGNFNPQKDILENFYKIDEPKRKVDFLKLLFNANCFDPTITISDTLKFRNRSNLSFEPVLLDSIGCILNTDDMNLMLRNETHVLLDTMLESGFSVSNTPPQCISPLTVLLAVEIHCKCAWMNNWTQVPYKRPRYHANPVNTTRPEEPLRLTHCPKNCKFQVLYQYAKQFIQSGVKIETMDLDIFVKDLELLILARTGCTIFELQEKLDFLTRPDFEEIPEEFFLYVDKLRKKLWLPDALWVSFLAGNLQAVKLLLPYWTAPPVALLLFQPDFQSSVQLWIKPLLDIGGIPHGTELYKLLVKKLEKTTELCIIEESDDESESSETVPVLTTCITYFRNKQKSPLSLLELAKYAVRASFAEQASQPGTSLPQLLSRDCPPGLIPYLTMQPE